MKIDEHYIRLMNEEIDGAISEEDAAVLSSWLAGNPEGARYYGELKETVRAIDGTGEVEPPPELRQRIFDSVYGRPGGAAAVRATGERSFWRSFFPVFAAGVAAGFILFAVVRPIIDRGSGGEYGATIGAVEEDAGETRRFDAYGVKGSVTPVIESGSVTVTLNLSAGSDASVLLDLGEGVSFESIRSSEGAAYQMEVGGSSVLLVHHGDAEYVLRLRSAQKASFDLRIFTDGKTVAAMSFAEGG
jgi:hypothetical protein